MGHTHEQTRNATDEHERLCRFLDAAHTGTADVVVGARANGNGREQQISVPRRVAQPLVDHAIEAARKLEVEFGFEPWRAPKGVPGKPEKKEGSGQ